ncbi:MAG: VIT and VWA domain-containing protein [Oleiphilaceae bacterium]|nr:VIT and VWA domain-containing protein [Oleiphilaceae bacterium]
MPSKLLLRLALFACSVLATISPQAHAAGLMTPANSGLPQLDIKEHHVVVTIEDGYAITSVTQTFHNPNNTELEAIYSFPVPEKAAVGEFTYWIDGKPVTGEVLEKQQARQVYEQEKAQGRETAITEKDAYKTFDSSVYPVRPQQDVKIRLVYLQPVHVDHGVGQYVYPLEEGGVDTDKLSFWDYNDTVTQAFSFEMNMRSSYPIDDIRLPAHPQAHITAASDQVWQVSLGNSNQFYTEENSPVKAPPASQLQTAKLDKDIVVYWRHAQGLPGSVDMVTHRAPGQSKGTFMMTITPGDDLGTITTGRDWVFVLDYSGSMQGKYASLVEGIRKGLNKLNPNDRFRLILFNNSSKELTSGYTDATPSNVQRAISQLENTKPNGGTNLYEGLERGIKGLDADRASALILVTDGVANVGITERKAFLDLMEKRDVRLFTFVMGNSANRPLLDGMTKVSNGFAMAISNSDDIVGKLLLATEKLKHEAYRDVTVEIDGVKTSNVTPERIGSVYRGQQIILFGHYYGHGPADVRIKGKVAGQKKVYATRFEFPEVSELNPELERLWAFAKIEHLQDRMHYLGADADTEQAITSLAKEYGLVTDYTSMVVVREEVFKQLNIQRDNAQRVATEHAAQAQRKAQPVRDHRQDQQQPAFQQPRAYPTSGGGSGSTDLIALLLLLPLLVQWHQQRRKSQA